MENQKKENINDKVGDEKEKKEAGSIDELAPVMPKKNVDIKSIVMIVVAIVIVLLASVGVATYGFKSENSFVKAVASTFGYPMALVDSRPVYLSDYWQELDLVLRACEQVGTNCQITEEDRQAVSERLVNENVWEILASRNGIEVGDEDLENEYQTIVTQNGGKEQFLKVIVDDFGWTEEKFRQKMYLEMLRGKLEEEMIEQVKASHILISVEAGASEEDIESARLKAQEVVGKLNEGGDFAKLALEYSDDPSAEQNGGNLGYFGRGVMVPEFEEAVFSMEVGQISNPVRSEYGWHVIKLEEKKGQIGSSFDDWLDEQKQNMSIWLFI